MAGATSCSGIPYPDTADDVPRLSVLDRNLKPWKYIGYPRFSSFIASENDFFILRRFSTVTVRVLLALQDELSELEEQLATIDAQLSEPSAPDIHNGSFRQETSELRLELIREIDGKLRAYNELVLQHTQLRTRPKVPQKDAENVSNWFHNHPGAIHPEETRYIDYQSDLFAMVPKEKSPLRVALEKSTYLRRLSIWRKSSKSNDPNVIYMSESRIEIFVGLVDTALGLGMLIGPLWLLAYVEDKRHRLIIITTFLICFLSLVTFTTAARPFEGLAATAAYAAVLVVFLQAT